MSETWLPIEFVHGRFCLPAGAEIQLGPTSVSIQSCGRVAVIDDPEVAGLGRGIHVWAESDAGIVIVTSRLGSSVYRVSLGTMSPTAIHELTRDPDPDLRFLNGMAAPGGRLVILTETEVMAISFSGEVAWCHSHGDISARIVEARDNIVWLETQWPNERRGMRAGYDLESGEPRTS